MLKNLWPAWPMEDVGNTSSSVKRRTTPPTPPADPLDDDETLTEGFVKNQDELASRMLVQFPAYGTRTQAQNNLNQTADWLLGGHNIPNQQQLRLQQQQQQAEDDNSSLPPVDEKQQKPATASPPETTKNYRDWDEDEQQLWVRTTPAPKRDPSIKYVSSLSTTEGKQQLKDPSKDWLLAYYYHTGVTPKLDTQRKNPMFERAKPRTPPKTSPEEPPLPSPPLPTPVQPETTPESNKIVIHQIPDDIDEEQEEEKTVIKTTASNPPPIKGETDVSSLADDRQHWMPDRLCKHCYACDAPFTVFRRRHHCRLCGQVFCNTCSGYFVPANQPPKQPQQQPPPQSSANKTILRTCKMCFEQVSAQQEEAADTGRKRKKKGEDSLIVSPSQQTKGTPNNQNNNSASDPASAHGPISPSLQQQLEKQDSVLHKMSKKRKESAFAKRRFFSQQQAMEKEEKEQTTLLLQNQTIKEKQHLHQETVSSRSMLMPLSPKREPPRTSSSSSKSENENDRRRLVEEGCRHLGLTAASHLEQMGEGLLASDAPLLWQAVSKLSQAEGGDPDLYSKWINKLMSLATRCCATVEPNIKKGDLLDIRPYVKIKGMFQ